MDSEEKQGKHLCPLLVHMAYDGCLQHLVEAFHESFNCRVVSNWPRELDDTQLGPGAEELTFKLMSWSVVMVCRQLKWDMQPVSRPHATVSAVICGMGTTSFQRVKWSTAVSQNM
jgi:hypothetical protein